MRRGEAGHVTIDKERGEEWEGSRIPVRKGDWIDRKVRVGKGRARKLTTT